MKNNAILIASIMFVAGSVSNRGGDSPGELTTPSNLRNSRLSVNDFHADSSVRGGSNEARGFSRGFIESEPPARPINPAVQADSSIRGGSRMARDRYWNYDQEPFSGYRGDRIRPDSSIRGGSNEARYSGRSFRSSVDENRNMTPYCDENLQPSPDSDLANADNDTHFRYLDDSGVSASANWNASDDLLRDGINSDSNIEYNNDASVGGAATAETGSASSSTSSESKDLNSSSQLESNISGQLNLDDQKDTTDLDTTDFQSSSQYTEGSLTAEGQRNSELTPDKSASTAANDLAQRVKATLTRESTGTHGGMVVRNIQVISHGGTVMLKGTVPSQKDKDMIEIRTREISGVNRVDNQLTVSAQADPSVRNFTSGRDLEDRTDELQHIDPLRD